MSNFMDDLDIRLKESLNLDLVKYESISEDVKTLYKNIQGIYIIYSDITGEIYLGQSKDIGSRLEQHKNNKNYVVKDLLNKKPSVYIIKLNRLEKKELEYLEAFLIVLFAYALEGREERLLNIQYNINHPLYNKYKKEGRFKESLSPLFIYDALMFALDKFENTHKDIIEGVKFLNTPLGKSYLDVFRVKQAKEEREIKKAIQQEKIKQIEQQRAKIKDTLDTKYNEFYNKTLSVWNKSEALNKFKRDNIYKFNIQNKISNIKYLKSSNIYGVWESGSNDLQIFYIKDYIKEYNINLSSEYVKRQIDTEKRHTRGYIKEGDCSEPYSYTLDPLLHDYYIKYRGVNIIKITLEEYYKLTEAV